MTIERRHPYPDATPDPCCDTCHGEGLTRKWVRTGDGNMEPHAVKCECADQ